LEWINESETNDFFDKGSFEIGNGISTRFWEDTWLEDTPLA
jgi:hypothetical protein